MKGFVTGGSGFVGKSFIEYVLRNHPEYTGLVILSRSEKADETINLSIGDRTDIVKIVRGDLSNINQLATYLAGCDVVFHIGAKVELWGQWEDFVEANIVGTTNLLTAAKKVGVKRFVHISTEATLLTGFNNGCLLNVDETAPLALNPPFYAPYTQSKAMTEKIVLEANDDQNSGFTTVAVKPRFVWGKGDTKVIPEIKRAMEEGRFKWFTPECVTSICHVENLCEGMILAASNGKPGNAYFLTDGETVNFNDFIKRLLGNSMDLSSIGSFPSSIAWYLAVVLENLPFMGYGVTREPILNRQMLGLLAQDVIVKDDKARREIGYMSHMTIERGVAEYLESTVAK
jgi:nucleoside-diphosphate-sugar epimerase